MKRLIILAVLLAAASAYGLSSIVKPNTFTANTPAKASEVNANYDTVYSGVNNIISYLNSAAGTLTTVDARLDVSINENGTPKDSVYLSYSTARPNRLLILNSSSQLPATATNADKVDGFHAYSTATASAVPVTDYTSKGGKLGGSWLYFQGIRDTFRNLSVTRPTAASVALTADEVVLQNASGYARSFATVSETATITTAGTSGLDTGAEASNTWYYLWIIAKNDGTINALLSTSTTAPTMPAGYTYKGLFGAVRNDGSSNFIDFAQKNNICKNLALVTMKDGSFTASAWTSFDATPYFPTTAKIWQVLFGLSGSNLMGIAGNSSGFGGEVFRPGAAIAYDASAIDPGLGATARIHYYILTTFNIDGSFYYYTGHANSTMYAWGWEY